MRGSAFKNVQIEEIVDSLPIANGRQVVQRITNPTFNNANFILPLDLKLDSTLKASQGNGSKRGGGAYRHLLPSRLLLLSLLLLRLNLEYMYSWWFGRNESIIV